MRPVWRIIGAIWAVKNRVGIKTLGSLIFHRNQRVTLGYGKEKSIPVAFRAASMDLQRMEIDRNQPELDAVRAALSRMQHEMRVTEGFVPSTVENAFFDDGEGFAVATDEFVFTTWDGVRFHYRLEQGVTVQMPEADLRDGGAAQNDCELFLWGTVFGTIAWLNGFVPLHASAVDMGDRIVAFTADSGGGKSTLAAALAILGYPHVCDDTLVLSFQKDAVHALPDQKPLKLWGDALAMTGTLPSRPVPSMPGKHYASAARKSEAPAPLTDLFFLDAGDEIALEPITGVAKLSLLPTALYRAFLHVARDDREAHQRILLEFCTKVRFWRLRRPIDPSRFGDDVVEIAHRIKSIGQVL